MSRILMVATSADALPNGQPTGLWLEEFAVPSIVLREAGHDRQEARSILLQQLPAFKDS